MKTNVFWNATLCSLVGVYRRLRRARVLQHKDEASLKRL